MDYQIRKATRNDVLAIAKFSREAADDQSTDLQRYSAMVEKQLHDFHTLVLVAEVNSVVVGYAVSELFHDQLDGKLYANALDVFVQNDYKTTELAKALMDEGETLLKAAGAAGICVTLSADDATRIGMYTQAGYSVENQDINLFKPLK